MKQIKFLLFVFACTNIFAACKKDKNTADQLPPATQTGANTFGCLVNGKVYVPKGYSGTGTPNPHIQYDINLNGRPYLGITADQIVNSNYRGSILIAYRNIDHLGTYLMPDDFNFSAGWTDVVGTCGTIAFDTTIKRWGGVITKLDIPNHIISGTFNCKFKAVQCDTVFITDGRFDIKF
jgi:hypothetical protein